MRRFLACMVLGAALLSPLAALAQSYTYSPGQEGRVGTVVTATDPNGNSRKVVLPAAQIVGMDAANANAACILGSSSTCLIATWDTHSFQIAPTVTVQNAAYSAGNSLGGKITVTGATRVSGGGGALINMRLRSAGGSTNQVYIYAWSKTPASTCTDKTAFSLSAADGPFAIPGFPISATLASPGSFDTSSYGQFPGLNAPFKNQDTSPGTAIYLCIVTVGAVTPAATTDLSLVLDGFQD